MPRPSSPQPYPGAHVGTRRRSRTSTRWVAGMLGLLSAGLWSCDGDGGTFPSNLREGQIGEVQVLLEVPRLPSGSLTQKLTWRSNGTWSLLEQIHYRGLMGDETVRRNPGDASPLAAGYASFITLVNEVEGLQLVNFPGLPDTLTVACAPHRTRITFTIKDEPRKRSTTWIRCTDGSLTTLTPTGAGPDDTAPRVVNAAGLVRDATVGLDFVSAYHGSVPFGTLDRGENSAAPLTAPFYIDDDAAWQAFWQAHASNNDAPSVDFDEEMVVVGAVGTRGEAGDSVEVRRILRVDQGTLTFVLERVPGDFCSPAARSHVPFHIVVAPRTPKPWRFGDVAVERVSCGA